MKKRIKKDLTLKWPIRTNGYKTSLANRDLKCELIDPQGNSQVIEVTTDEHVVIIHLTPSLQTSCGRYRLTLWENYGKDGQTVVDKSNAIELVSSTEREDVTDNMLPTASEEINLQGDDLETGATVIGQQQADWNQTDTTEASFIKNKPTSMPASDVQSWAKAAQKPTYTAQEVGAAESGHNHDGVYSPVSHNHDGVYSPVGHNHDGVYSPTSHNHDGVYAASDHTHDEYVEKEDGKGLIDEAPSNGYAYVRIDEGWEKPLANMIMYDEQNCLDEVVDSKANKPTSASATPTTWQDNTNYSLGTVDGTLNIGNVAGSQEGIIIYFTAGTDFALNEGSTPLDWMDGEAPDAPEVGKSYMLTIYNGIYDLRKHGVPTTETEEEA